MLLLREKLKEKELILGTRSPRRHHLMRQLGIPFRIIIRSIKEEGPAGMQGQELACYLSEQKSDAYKKELSNPENIILTADTIVWLDGKSLDKPENPFEAAGMLKQLSGRKHRVITGVTLANANTRKTFSASTDVWFKKLTEAEINYYIDEFNPVDKAGAYGVQEWIGIIGIERIEGSYYNVVGLPVQMVYEELWNFAESMEKRQGTGPRHL
jgi:septum formation protein